MFYRRIGWTCECFIIGNEKDDNEVSIKQTLIRKNDCILPYNPNLVTKIVKMQKYFYLCTNKRKKLSIIGKTNRDEIQNQMRLKFARKLQKRNVTEKSHTSYSQKWLSNVN